MGQGEAFINALKQGWEKNVNISLSRSVAFIMCAFIRQGLEMVGKIGITGKLTKLKKASVGPHA